ncbi:MAG: hypothetical protein K0S08_982 [Gammaproteobacteria bacterium]|jgi:hypothetical protein|nr:hypothetical protein [Gammaproteobacteria bacterium]
MEFGEKTGTGENAITPEDQADAGSQSEISEAAQIVVTTVSENQAIIPSEPQKVAKNILSQVIHSQFFHETLKRSHNTLIEKHWPSFVLAPVIEYSTSTFAGGMVGSLIRAKTAELFYEVYGASLAGSLCFAIVNLAIGIGKNVSTKRHTIELTRVAIIKYLKDSQESLENTDAKDLIQELLTGLDNQPDLDLSPEQRLVLYEKVKIDGKELSRNFFYNALVAGFIFSALNFGLNLVAAWESNNKYWVIFALRSITAIAYPALTRFGFWFAVPFWHALISGLVGFNIQTLTEYFIFPRLVSDLAKAAVSAAIAGPASAVSRIAVKVYDYCRGESLSTNISTKSRWSGFINRISFWRHTAPDEHQPLLGDRQESAPPAARL